MTHSILPQGFKFQIQQIAISYSEKGKKILTDFGLDEWVADNVKAKGSVWPNAREQENAARLQFNYQAGGRDEAAGKPLELELINYENGHNYLHSIYGYTEFRDFSVVAHIGMHVTEEELAKVDEYFTSIGIIVAQRVNTFEHTNDHIKGKREYTYVIYDTSREIGTCMKFIVRRDIEQK